MSGVPVAPRLEVVEYTDPLCPWAWGSEPTFRRLRQALEGRARWRRVYCILFDDDDDPAPDLAAETAWYARYVEEIGAHTRAPYAARLSRVAASSWPSSLVAKAAEAQGEKVAARALRRLRETVFVLGEPADTLDLALGAVRDVPGLDPDRLVSDAASKSVREAVVADRAEARRPVPEVLAPPPGDTPHPGAAKETDDGTGLRYALPTVLVRGEAGYRAVPGWRPYDEYAAAVEELSPGLMAPVRPGPAGEVLRHHRTLTEPERTALVCGPWPPPDAVRTDTANGPLWLCPSEAETHPATRPATTPAR
ncbi:DsbA family protein [Streptomyces sp. NPDC102360]|uniref:DsbA family oxidoreductase n=1 Tax=Streptomyces sp. NPDC102360 TaxID=3366160 RepID=UPI003823F615